MFIGRDVDPGPSINSCPFGQDFHLIIQTSWAIFPWKAGIDESRAVSKIAIVGTVVVET
jgi:hypothetical protein